MGCPAPPSPSLGVAPSRGPRPILDNSTFVYIIADPSSKSAAQAVEACVKREIKHRVIPFSPYMHYAEKVGKVAEILAAVTKEEIDAHPVLKALWRVT